MTWPHSEGDSVPGGRVRRKDQQALGVFIHAAAQLLILPPQAEFVKILGHPFGIPGGDFAVTQVMRGRIRPHDDDVALLHTLARPVAADGVGQRLQAVLRNIAAALGGDAVDAVVEHLRLIGQHKKVAAEHGVIPISHVIAEGDHPHAQLVDHLVLFLHFRHDVAVEVECVLLDQIQHVAHAARGVNAKNHVDMVGQFIPSKPIEPPQNAFFFQKDSASARIFLPNGEEKRRRTTKYFLNKDEERVRAMKVRRTIGGVLFGMGCAVTFVGILATVLPMIQNDQLQLVLSSFEMPSSNLIVSAINGAMTYALHHCYGVLLCGIVMMAAGMGILLSRPRRRSARRRTASPYSRPCPHPNPYGRKMMPTGRLEAAGNQSQPLRWGDL